MSIYSAVLEPVSPKNSSKNFHLESSPLNETAQEDKAFGILRNHAACGVRYQQALREEWENVIF